jgi:hypothetical protein
MAKAVKIEMNYYEKLVAKINRLAKENPRSAIAMNVETFEVVAKSGNLKSLEKKIASSKTGISCHSTVVFQNRSQKVAWIL